MRVLCLTRAWEQITGYTWPGGDIIIPTTISGVSVMHIDDYAFYRNTALTSADIPNGVTSIGNYAFDSRSSLVRNI